MSVEILENYFNIKPETSIREGKYVRYIVNDSLYTIITVTHMEQDALIELYEMSEHMANYGDNQVSTFVAGKDSKFLVTHEDQDYVLMHNYYQPQSRGTNSGRELAMFHNRGSAIQGSFSTSNRIGEWKNLWGKRLEQMENVWSGMAQEQPREEFERLFIESFPYYLGMCENAIQYVTDAEMDEEPINSDGGTICHGRFYEGVWGNQLEIKDPFEWVIDHPGRDIAEWIRDRYFRSVGTLQPDLSLFMEGYQSVTPLSNFSWRLIYARLLFPLHYFACVEEYFLTSSQWTQKQLEETLSRYMRDSQDHELFLRNFYEMAGTERSMFPAVGWL